MLKRLKAEWDYFRLGLRRESELKEEFAKFGMDYTVFPLEARQRLVDEAVMRRDPASIVADKVPLFRWIALQAYMKIHSSIFPLEEHPSWVREAYDGIVALSSNEGGPSWARAAYADITAGAVRKKSNGTTSTVKDKTD
jgi:hypothetical protein